jgi:phage gp16-like protein
MSASSRRDQARNTELAKIHIAKAQLRLDDDTYRDMLWTLARVRTAKELTSDGRRRVLDHLRSRGFVDRGRGRPHNANNSALIRKIEALLADAKRPWAYADGMAKHMFKVDRVTFCSYEQLRKLVAALTYDAKRRARKEPPVPTGSDAAAASAASQSSDEDQS